MITIEKLKQQGFIGYCDNSKYRRATLKKVHLDALSNGKYMLLARIIDDNIEYIRKDGRATFKNKDNTAIISLPVDNIKDSMVRKLSDDCEEHVFFVSDICYRLVVFGLKMYDVEF